MQKIQAAGLVVALNLVGGAALAAPPAWVNGKDPRYSSAEYVIGVGEGKSQKAADVDARAEVSRIFESKVQAVISDYQAAASKVNGSGKGVSVEVQSIASFQKVTTAKTLKGLEVSQRAKDGGTHYALALLSRKQCINSLTEEIESIDSKINGAVSKAEGGDKLKAFKYYGQAISLMDEREALNAMLRVCDKGGRGIPAPVSLDDLVANFDDAAEGFKLGIIIEGGGGDRVRDCLMEQLSDKGYQISDKLENEDDYGDEDEDEEEDEEDEDDISGFDAILKGKLKSEKAGDVAGSKLVRTELTLKLINGKTNKVVKSFSGMRKEGRPTIKASASLAAYKICKKDVKSIAAAIDKYFKR